MDLVERLQRIIALEFLDMSILTYIAEAVNEIERLREEIEDMHRRERSTALQYLGNEGQWCDLIGKKDKEIELLREENYRQRQHIMLLYSAVSTEHEIIRAAALKEGE